MDNKMIVVVKGIILYNARVLIIKRSYNDDIGGGHWEFVGGKVNQGESLEEALIREVQEETSLEIVIDKILYATTSKIDPKNTTVVIVYKCLAQNNHIQLSKEHSEYRWVFEKELRELVSMDIIEDMDKYNVFPIIFKREKNSQR